QRVPGAGVGEEVRVLRCDQEVGRDEDHGSQYGEQEERCHDPFGPLGRPWVGVGLPVDVRGQPGVREAATLLARDRADAALGGGAVAIVAHSRSRFAFAPSHTAQATARDRTLVHTYRPSVTGPWWPREMPPGDPVPSSAWRWATTSRLSSGERFASLKTGMFCGPVSMASYTCWGSTPITG